MDMFCACDLRFCTQDAKFCVKVISLLPRALSQHASRQSACLDSSCSLKHAETWTSTGRMGQADMKVLNTSCVQEVDLSIVADMGTLQRLPRIVGDGAPLDDPCGKQPAKHGDHQQPACMTSLAHQICLPRKVPRAWVVAVRWSSCT